MPLRILLPLCAFVIAGPLGAAPRPPETAKLADVAAGRVTEAQASWWGFTPGDATAQLQAAINSGVAKLTIDNVGEPWVVEPLHLASHQTIVFAEGVVLEAKPGSFLGTNDSLLTARDTVDVKLIGEGEGALLRMHKADYDDPARYKKAEWRHALDLRSVDGFEVTNLTFRGSGGDGVYFGVSSSGLPCRNVTLRDLILDDHYRQGISVISAENVLCERVVMSNTGGTPPKAGIDFEPNRASEKIVNFVMRDCIAENNEGAAYVWYLPNLKASSDPVSVTLENCIARGTHPVTFSVVTGNGPKDSVGGFIKAVNCRFEGGTGGAVSVSNTPPNALQVILDHVTIVDPIPDKPALAPIQLSSRRGAIEPAGNLVLQDVVLIDPVERQPLTYKTWSMGVGLGHVSGNLFVERNGQRTEYTLTPEQIEAWVPTVKTQQVPVYDMTGRQFEPAALPGELKPPNARVRDGAEYRLYAGQGDAVKVTVRSTQLAKLAGSPVKVNATNAAGETVAAVEIPFQETGDLAFTAPAAGDYHLEIDCGSNLAAITATSHPVVLTTENGPIHFVGATSDLYFLVPAGTPQFAVTAMGDNAGEAVKATVWSPAGEVVWTQDNVTEPAVYLHDGAAPTDEVWRLRLEKPSQLAIEDHFLLLHGIPPFLGGSPADLLKPAG